MSSASGPSRPQDNLARHRLMLHMFHQLRQGCRAAEQQEEPAVVEAGEATQVAEEVVGVVVVVMAVMVVVVIIGRKSRSILTGIPGSTQTTHSPGGGGWRWRWW